MKERPGRGEDNIKMDLEDVGGEHIDWIHLTQEKEH
jgi:hypothetical protein